MQNKKMKKHHRVNQFIFNSFDKYNRLELMGTLTVQLTTSIKFSTIHGSLLLLEDGEAREDVDWRLSLL